MEGWQKKIVQDNTVELSDITECSPIFIRTLLKKNVISVTEKQKWDRISDREGQLVQCLAFYDSIVKKHNGFKILLEICIDPKMANQAVAIFLINKAKEAGKWNLLPQFARDFFLSLPAEEQLSSELNENANCAGQLPAPALVTDVADAAASSSSVSSQSSNNETQSQLNQLPKELEEFVCHGKELDVQVRKPEGQVSQVSLGESKYILPPKGKGYAFILNIIEFLNQLKREGAEQDTEYMIKLLEGLGYKIFPKKYQLYSVTWNKDIIVEEFKKFKATCIQDAVDSIIVFFGSHGYKDHLLTSDEQIMDVQAEIIFPLQIGRAELDKPVAKIFIDQTCRVDPPPSVPIPAVVPASFEDTIHIQAQLPKLEANRDFKCGSYFVIVLAYVLMTKAWNTPLHTMLEETQHLLHRMSRRAGMGSLQVDQFSTRLTTPLYFFTR